MCEVVHEVYGKCSRKEHDGVLHRTGRAPEPTVYWKVDSD